jgi:hypothetical protein
MRRAWGGEDQFPLPSVLEGFGGALPFRRKGSSSLIPDARVSWMTASMVRACQQSSL